MIDLVDDSPIKIVHIIFDCILEYLEKDITNKAHHKWLFKLLDTCISEGDNIGKPIDSKFIERLEYIKNWQPPWNVVNEYLTNLRNQLPEDSYRNKDLHGHLYGGDVIGDVDHMMEYACMKIRGREPDSIQKENIRYYNPYRHATRIIGISFDTWYVGEVKDQYIAEIEVFDLLKEKGYIKDGD